MTRRVRPLRSRASWTDDHHMQLWCGWDFFRTAWGHLERLSDDELREAVADMAACWEERREEIYATEHRKHQPPWFAKYAADPQKLIDEIRADREYMAEQHRRGGYFPRSEMNDYTSRLAGAAAVTD